MKFVLIVSLVLIAVSLSYAIKSNKLKVYECFNIDRISLTGGQPCNISEMSQVTGGRAVNPFTGQQIQASNVVTRGQPITPRYVDNPYETPTAQGKIISVNTQAGNPGIAFQQGATIVVYDSLPMDGRGTFNFFDGVNVRAFPDTNLTENRLGVGKSMAIQEIWFSVVTKVAGAVTLNTVLATAQAAFYLSSFSILVGGSQILENVPLTAMQSLFNSDSKFLNQDVLKLKTNTVIPSMYEFVLSLKAPVLTVTAGAFLQCTIKGTGALLSPKQTL